MRGLRNLVRGHFEATQLLIVFVLSLMIAGACFASIPWTAGTDLGLPVAGLAYVSCFAALAMLVGIFGVSFNAGTERLKTWAAHDSGDEEITVRLGADLLKALDGEIDAAKREPKPTRPEMIRRLLEKALVRE